MENSNITETKGGQKTITQGTTYYLEQIKKYEGSYEVLMIYLDNLVGEELQAVAEELSTSKFEDVRQKAEDKLDEIKTLKNFGIIIGTTQETVVRILINEIGFGESFNCLMLGTVHDRINDILCGSPHELCLDPKEYDRKLREGTLDEYKTAA